MPYPDHMMRNPDVPISLAFGIALVFTTKHYVADYLLQSNWMARGKERVTGWLRPLAAHGLVHAGLALAIVLAVDASRWWLALLDFIIHVLVDWGKARVALQNQWSANQYQFWLLVGFDQYLHQVTNLVLAALLIAR